MLDAAFLGPMAENGPQFEQWVVDAVRDHVYWRKNAHPDDPAAITAAAHLTPEFQGVVARTDDALRRVAGRLKRSVPWFSPRYVGHMASDLLMPGLVGRILGTLYNPNNVSDDSGGPALQMELEVGHQLAAMFGLPQETAWGHLTSGGTVANYEALRSMQALRLFPLALAAGAKLAGITLIDTPIAWLTDPATTTWQLANVSMDDVMPLRSATHTAAFEQGGRALLAELHEAVEAHRIETMGAVDFYAHHGVQQPVLVAPISAHYSWSRAAKLTGIGTRHIVKVDVDERMRLDSAALNETLSRLQAAQTPVLGCICVYGTTEFGSLDPVHAVVEARDRFGEQGLAFGVHVDAAWGGYMSSVFRLPSGELRDKTEMRESFRYFPSDEVFAATAALGDVDSITVDPHKLGFMPYPAGALVFREREWARLQTEGAPYVFDDAGSAQIEPPLALEHLGKYVLEGSKPGASATSVAVTHDVFPLHCEGFGEIIASTVHASEVFYDRVMVLADSLSDVARIVVPFEPDTNIVCLAVNPTDNGSLEICNALTRQLFDTMRFRLDQPLQVSEVIGSFTSLTRNRLTDTAARRMESALGLSPGELDADPSAHVFVLRHTLMSPWLRRKAAGGRDYLDVYLEFLERQIRNALR
ncbi:MAG: glutamate/tyrosine decarboxylase-like PLP-dependent enzyme [Flavobacteriales bacterium]|jgi:glutamate/tyrosine decarboxylase-like PLP-dependent enzyme